jgi:hypothetical protein
MIVKRKKSKKDGAKDVAKKRKRECCCAILFHGILDDVYIGPLEMTIRERRKSAIGN